LSGLVFGAAGLVLMGAGIARAAGVSYTFRNVAVLDSKVAGEDISGNFQLGAVNSAGTVIFVSPTDAGEGSFVIEPDGKATRISKPGTASPAGGTFGTYISNNVLINHLGTIAIPVSIDRGSGEHREHLMFDKPTNQWKAVVAPGTPPLDAGTVIQPRSFPALNNKNELAFGAEVTGTGAGPDVTSACID